VWLRLRTADHPPPTIKKKRGVAGGQRCYAYATQLKEGAGRKKGKEKMEK
jgi:hypothetical protein